MAKFSNPETEQYAFNSSITFNSLSGFFAILLIIGILVPSTGWGIIAVILGPIFFIIAFVRNVTFAMKTVSKNRRTYAIIASVITVLPVIAFFVLLFRDVR